MLPLEEKLLFPAFFLQAEFMNCKECKFYHFGTFNHFSNYCERVDQYVYESELKCPAFLELQKKDKLIILFRKIDNALNKKSRTRKCFF